MTVRVKRGGAWIDADGYQVGDELEFAGFTAGVVERIWKGDDGVPQIDVRVALRKPADFVRFHFTKCDAHESELGKPCAKCGGFHGKEMKA